MRSLQVLKKNGSSGRTRTYNPPVNSRMLCQLLIDSKGFYSRSWASKPLYLWGFAGQLAGQFPLACCGLPTRLNP